MAKKLSRTMQEALTKLRQGWIYRYAWFGVWITPDGQQESYPATMRPTLDGLVKRGLAKEKYHFVPGGLGHTDYTLAEQEA
jgi:hypothetical protein